SLKAVGIILVVAMLVAPGAIAFLLTDRFDRMLLIASSVAIGSSIVGTLVSFHIDGATGPCIVLIQSTIFIATFVYNQMASNRTGTDDQTAQPAE
ncbi:MAG: iron ABC transporter permease, partial [Hyphomicrobium sp.]